MKINLDVDRITVLHSLPTVRPTTNPYLQMLRTRLRETDGVEFVDFSYRRALTGRYDVFHVHWPETLLGGSTRLKTVARQLLLTAFLFRLTVLGIPVVRTAHNVELPQGLRRHEYLLLAWMERRTKLRIRLNERTPADPRAASVLIPHGHYRDWFASFPQPPATPGQLGYAGLIRRYKGVETLIEAFRTVEDADLRLRVGGRPSTDELADTLRRLSEGDERIELLLQFLSEAEFAALISSSELVVLPYRFMHNSGGALASLSLDRPVLVPANEVNADLAAEVGPGWVHLFDGDLDAADLVRARRAIDTRTSARPDLSRREWSNAAVQHLAAYRQAITLGRRGRRARRRSSV